MTEGYRQKGMNGETCSSVGSSVLSTFNMIIIQSLDWNFYGTQQTDFTLHSKEKMFSKSHGIFETMIEGLPYQILILKIVHLPESSRDNINTLKL